MYVKDTDYNIVVQMATSVVDVAVWTSSGLNNRRGRAVKRLHVNKSNLNIGGVTN